MNKLEKLLLSWKDKKHLNKGLDEFFTKETKKSLKKSWLNSKNNI